MKIYCPKNKKKVRSKKNPNIITNFETKIYNLYNDGKIRFPVHLTKGNENQLCEVFRYISKNDWVLSSWRNHGHALLHGVPEKKLFNQIMKGKSMYISSKKK